MLSQQSSSVASSDARGESAESEAESFLVFFKTSLFSEDYLFIISGLSLYLITFIPK